MFDFIIEQLKPKSSVVEDAESKLNVKEIVQVKSPVFNYKRSRDIKDEWQEFEYNFSEIDRIESVEAFMSLSFGKKLALFMKEGFEIVGHDQAAIDYIERRLNEICYVSKTTLNLLISDIAKNLIRYSNCFILTKRNALLSGGYTRIDNKGKKIEPIASLHILPTSMMQVKRDENGIPIAYRQYDKSGWSSMTPEDQVKNSKEYKASEIIHIYVDKVEGFSTGKPRVWQAIEDIKALRRIETDIEILVHQGVMPLIQYKVGTEKSPADILPNGKDEIAVATEFLSLHPPEGVLVTSERHEIKMVGAEGRALRAETYLDYFKKRVLSALHLSGVDIGEGDTANRSTAASMSRSLVDVVKSDQLALEEHLFSQIIIPLLTESEPPEKPAYDWLNEEKQVWIKFKEIDIDHQLKKENGTIQLFLNNLLTHDEARLRINESSLEDSEKEGLFSNMFQHAMTLLGSASDPSSPLSYAAVDNPNVPIEQKHISKAISVQKDLAKTEVKAKAIGKPTQKKK